MLSITIPRGLVPARFEMLEAQSLHSAPWELEVPSTPYRE
jgi:hypothetical protein